MTSDQNKRIVQRLVDEFWNHGYTATADELLAPSFRNFDPNNTGVIGREDFKLWAGYLRSAFPDFHVTVDEMIGEADRVVKSWTARGTHREEFLGCLPTGRKIAYSGVSIYHLVKGKVVEISWSYDMLGLLLQLGVGLKQEY